MDERSKHMLRLDVLRFLAACLVCLNHFATYSIKEIGVSYETSERAFPVLSIFEDAGAVGVQVFFVISGFVIAFSASRRMGKHGAVAFVWARVWRIAPALWISSLIGALALWWGGDNSANLMLKLVKSVLLIPQAPHIDGVIWTLMVEAVFYAVIAVSIWIFGQVPLRRIAICLGILGSLYLALLFFADHCEWQFLSTQLNQFSYSLLLLRHGVFFALGIMLWVGGKTRRMHHVQWLILFSVFGAVEIWLAMDQRLGTFIFAIVICTLFAWFAFAAFQLQSLRVGGRGLRFLGRLSYPLYLNHYTFGMCCTFWFASVRPSETAVLVTCLVAVSGVSLVVLSLETAVQRLIQPRGIFRTIVRPPLT